MTLKKHIRIVVPENFDIENIIKNNLPTFKYNIDFFNYILYFIIERNSYKNEEPDSHAGRNFIEINSKKIQRFNHDYAKHLKYLIDNKVLIRKPYKVGESSFKYRLTGKYRIGNNRVNIKLVYRDITDKILVNNIRKLDGEKITHEFRMKYKFLIRHLKNENITFDFEEAINEVNEGDLVNSNYKKYQKNIIAMTHFYNGSLKIYYKPKTDGRVHTPITSLKKTTRKHLTLDSRALAEVDLSNSILYFLYIALLQPMKFGGIDNLKNNVPYMLVNLAKELDAVELEEFGRLAVSGEIYSIFMDDFFYTFSSAYIHWACKKITGDYFNGSPEQLRKVVKKKILAMIFASNVHYVAEQKVFARRFPTIYKLLYKLKEGEDNLDKKEKKIYHKSLSHFLFQMEAHFMLNIVARNYNKDKHGKKQLIMSLHDCIITTKDNVEHLQKFLVNSFIEEVGIAPNTKIKFWESEEKPELERSITLSTKTLSTSA